MIRSVPSVDLDPLALTSVKGGSTPHREGKVAYRVIQARRRNANKIMPDFVRAWHWVNQQRHNGAVDQPNAAPLPTNHRFY